MSTKIYNAYRVKVDTLQELESITSRFRNAAGTLSRELFLELLVAKVVDIIDLEDSSDDKKSPLSSAWLNVQEEIIKAEKSSQISPPFNISCTASVIIGNDGYIYFKVFAESRRFIELPKKFPEFEDFSYWDNTDPPDNVTQEEWEERGNTWHRLLEPDYVFSNHGLVVEYSNDTFVPTAEDVLPNLPDFESRVKKAKENKALKKFCEEEKPESINEMLSGFKEWKAENPSILNEIEEEVRNTIPKVITKDLLLGK